MGKTGLIATVLVVALAVLGVSIANLVFTIIHHYDGNHSVSAKNNTPSTPTSPDTSSNRPKATGPISQSDGFTKAAEILKSGLDLSVDPCEDFYAFACNKYLKDNPVPEGLNRIGTYDQAQNLVDTIIVEALDKMNVNDKGLSQTEKFVKFTYDKCVENEKHPEAKKSRELNENLGKAFNGIPLLQDKWEEKKDLSGFLTVTAEWDREYSVSSIIGTIVTADYRNVKQNELFLSSPRFALPIDFYIKATFQSSLQDHRDKVLELFKTFAKSLKITVNEKKIAQDVDDLVAFEIALAMNVIPDSLLKNFDVQYNKYSYDQFSNFYPNLRLYLSELTKGYKDINKVNIIVTQPRYFEALNTLLGSAKFETAFNYISYVYLRNFKDFIGGETKELIQMIESFTVNPRDTIEYEEAKLECVSTIKDFMPYGPGFIYVKSLEGDRRKKILADIELQTELVINEFLNNVKTLDWMSEDSKAAVKKKANGLKKNLGVPLVMKEAVEDNNFEELDAYHEGYTKLQNTETSYFDLLNNIGKAQQNREGLGNLNRAVDRLNFLDSPATVNAWYAPELNSITIPMAILNPPYYNLDFPQAYNYAGQGGTLGHELTHGFDSDGVQFGPDGSLSSGQECNLKYCTWLDRKSTAGFLDMAQCVISQYSEQCCPLETGNVHCANGDITQGENIADIGGQLAAYNAYRVWVEKHNKGEEERLKGLEDFTSNQIFWITYGYSWCMNQRPENLVNQMLTNPHAPGKCRVNQVMQDIPAFAKDFGCKSGQKLFPVPEKRCKVWTGV